MKSLTIQFYIFFFLVLLSLSCTNTKVETLNAIDGPYIYSQNDNFSVITVEMKSDSTYFISKENVKNWKEQFKAKVSNTDNDYFSFSLMSDHKVPKDIYESQEKILVTSDIEGNFNALYSLLLGNKVMDSDYEWIYGKGHLVVNGDVFDRGDNVIPCLWLLYKLEQDALKAGGQVHLILGNHEVMNLQNNIRYVHPKYIELAKVIAKNENKKEAYKQLLSNENVLVDWIKSKNTVEKIGNLLFVHGGISEELVDAGLYIDDINHIVRKNITIDLKKNKSNDGYVDLVFSNKGPLWYRGLVKDYKNKYTKISLENLDAILKYYGVEHVVVGHTIVEDEITSDFGGKVIRVDIKHPKEKFSGKSQALLIENNIHYKVNDKGERFSLNSKD